MTRNPPNRIRGLGFTTKADHLRELDKHMKEMFRPAVMVSYAPEDQLFGKLD